MTDRGTASILRERFHRADLLTAFTDAYGGTGCENDCGYVFPADDPVGYDCPTCGHDNFRRSRSKYLYWRIAV